MEKSRDVPFILVVINSSLQIYAVYKAVARGRVVGFRPPQNCFEIRLNN